MPFKKRYPISEKALSLSQKEFNEYLSKSKASNSSKERYIRARKEYQSKQKITENIEYSEGKQQEYNDTNKALARKVAYAKLPLRLKILKTNYDYAIEELKNNFKALLKYRYNANMLMLKCAFMIINKKGKIEKFVMNFQVGELRENFFTVASKTAKPNNFKEAFYSEKYGGIEPKIRRVVFSASIKGILTIWIEIKFYYKRERRL